MAVTASDKEQIILRDLTARTGLAFRRLGGIGFQTQAQADLVFSVLADWPRKLENDPTHRQAVYAVFGAPRAGKYLPRLVEWCIAEETLLGKDILVGAIENNFSPDYGAEIWDLALSLPPRVGRFRLLARLAESPEWHDRVVSYVMLQLENETLTKSDLTQVSAINDPAVRDWLLANADRLGVPHVVARLKRVCTGALPSPLQRHSGEPDLSEEDYSSEVDFEDLPAKLRQLGDERSLRLPQSILNASTYQFLRQDSWLLTPALRGRKGAYVLWLRAEDETTARIVVLRQKTSPHGRTASRDRDRNRARHSG